MHKYNHLYCKYVCGWEDGLSVILASSYVLHTLDSQSSTHCLIKGTYSSTVWKMVYSFKHTPPWEMESYSQTVL